MNSVSVCLPYYLNAGMLARQYSEIAAYPEEVKSHLELVVVDDGSPRDPAVDVARPPGLPPVKIFRMALDVRWNQDACRNLAAAQAAFPWLLLTDIDHLIPANTARRVVEMSLRRDCVYRFARVSAPDLSPYKPHPNSWLMTRALYDAIGGYDERFAGFYGTDAPFRDACRQHATAVVDLKEHLVRVPREVIPDASTTTYGRKEPQDGENIRRIKAEIAALPPEQRRPQRRGFAWSRVL